MAAKVRNALTHFRLLARSDNIEIRLHETVLYNSIYWSDDEIFANQHAYGTSAAHTPVFRLHKSADGDMAATYLDSFEKVWNETKLALHAEH